MASKRVLVVTVELQDGELTSTENFMLLRQVYTLPIAQDLAVEKDPILARVSSYIDDALKASHAQSPMQKQAAHPAAVPGVWMTSDDARKMDCQGVEWRIDLGDPRASVTASPVDSFVHWPR